MSALKMQPGFSLIELSIVLVILGLLTGGILTGQSLIRASELRALTTEYTRYSTAVQTFRDKYFASPGDMDNAESFWTQDTNCAGTYAGTVPAAGTCNGNRDGIVYGAAAASQTGEVFQFWKQLAFAGLIEGAYTGFAGPAGSGYDTILGVNAPQSKLSGAGWSAQSAPNYAGDASSYALDFGNGFVFGGVNSSGPATSPALKPEEAWNIDTKLDDGKPGSGKVIAIYWATCANAASNTDYVAPYNLGISTKQCALWFRKAF